MQKVSVAVTGIAVKIEEQYTAVRMSHLIMVFNVLQQREELPSGATPTLEHPDSDRFKKLQAEIAAEYELEVLRALGFICHVDPPHKFVTNLLGLVFYDTKTREPNIPQGLAQV